MTDIERLPFVCITIYQPYVHATPVSGLLLPLTFSFYHASLVRISSGFKNFYDETSLITAYRV